MSVRKMKGEYHIGCDAAGCNASVNTQIRGSKVVAYSAAKARGWLARHVGSLWRHYCGKPCYDAANAPVDSQGE